MSGKSGGDGNIQIYLRVRPSKKPSGYFQVGGGSEETKQEASTVTVRLPDTFRSDYVNNTKLRYDFQFNGVLPMNATQEEVFKKVGTSAVQNALDGFNSTIFAYGQTGSGKTFTITGGPEKYSDRGIIPRAISMIFNEFAKRTDVQFKSYISYLEIYNEQGYDLLDPSHETKALEELNKVHMLEDEYGNFHLKNLSMHPASTEVEALDLLFMGDTNRAIAETPMNQASSRSHCIFTLSLEVRQVGSDLVRRSKLHLVDLAGSERVAKTNSSGSILKEAICINGSLFFLEMVIVALHEKATKGRTHIPYRNSMMTSILRDSLGGNCKTIMIATINPEASHTDESLSTCKFAQRVALIKNKATVNEDVDPSIVIGKLKNENLNLREEINFLKGEAGEGDALTPKELEDLRGKCQAYVDDTDPQSTLNVGALTLTKIKHAFSMLKTIALSARVAGGGRGGIQSDGDVNEEIEALKSCLLQRDNEIAILVNMVKKGKTVDDVASARVRTADRSMSGSIDDTNRSMTSSISSATTRAEVWGEDSKHAPGQVRRVVAPPKLSQSMDLQTMAKVREKQREETIVKRHLFGVPPPDDKSLFEDPAICFEWFRERCALNSAIEENKTTLKQKYEEARILGERANQSRGTISYLKNSIEAIRREKAIQGMISDGQAKESGDGDGDEEETYRRAIEQEKVVYKESFEALRVLKPEIEHIKKILEKSRVTLQSQFDQWFNNLHSRGGVISANPHASVYSGGDADSEDSVSQRTERTERLGFESKAIYETEAKERKSSTKHNSTESKDLSTPGGGGSRAVDDIDDDIMAFYHAKEELLKRRGDAVGR